MARVVVHPLAGFDHDTVVVEVDGAPIARVDGLTAPVPRVDGEPSISGEAPDGQATITVRVPRRELRADQSLQLVGEVHILATVHGGALTLQLPAEGSVGFA